MPCPSSSTAPKPGTITQCPCLLLRDRQNHRGCPVTPELRHMPTTCLGNPHVECSGCVYREPHSPQIPTLPEQRRKVKGRMIFFFRRARPEGPRSHRGQRGNVTGIPERTFHICSRSLRLESLACLSFSQELEFLKCSL